MAVVVLLISVCTALQTKGVLSKVYSKHGLENYYSEMMSQAPKTFQERVGEEEEYTGWWIFGKSLRMYNTRLSNVDMGEIKQVGFDNQNNYIFTADAMTATLSYKWKFRWFLVPFTHTH